MATGRPEPGALRRAGTAALLGAGLAVVVSFLDLGQSLIADPFRLQPRGVALLTTALALLSAIGATLLALVARMSPRRAALALAWLAAVALTISAAVDLLLTTPFPPTQQARATLVGILLPVLMRRASLLTRMVVAASVLLLVIGVRLGLGFRCVEVRADADGTATLAAADATRPNVVLMVLDTLRADHLSGHGYPRPTTPTLDGLAAAGLSFPLAYAQASWTRPSTASILSSLYPSQHGHGGNQTSRLADSVTTLPEVLRAAGYETAAFSSNGNVIPEAGFAQGFDIFNACEDVGRSRSSLVLGAWRRLDALAAWLTGSASPLRFTRVQKELDGVVGNRKSDLIADEAFERWFEGRRDDRPFFAYLHLMSPHVPYDPSPESRKLVGAPLEAVVRQTPRRSDDCFSRGEEISSERRQELIALYDACIRDADGFVAAVLARLERHGLAERTMIVIMADHGEEFFEHANWGHGQSLYEELTRIPLIIRRPDGRETGRRLAAPVMAVDVMPTILAEAGAPLPPEAVGRSLLDRESSPHDVAISEMLRPACSVWTLVRERRKYLEWRRPDGGDGSAVYDLERDPGEQTAITGDGTQELATRLAQHRREASRVAHKPGEDALSPQQEDRLRALGYVR